jgi:alanyl-tRNA synthetase
MLKNPHYIIADHVRTIAFCVADGVQSGPKGRGYVLRRLLRRTMSASRRLGIDIANREYYQDLVTSVLGIYDGFYPEIVENESNIIDALLLEATKYQKAINTGNKEWTKILKKQDSTTNFTEIAWNLYQTFGVPFEVSEDVLEENNLVLDTMELEELIAKHQKNSQATSAGMFKSGLGENNAKTTALHTTTHILHKVLISVLDPEFDFGTIAEGGISNIRQMGSAITSEKARFDFSFDRKLTDEELQTIESKVQDLISQNLEMTKVETSPIEAKKLGAIGLFGEKYGDKVTIYTLEDNSKKPISREFCGGPHITNTSEIANVGKFKILKEKSSSSGIRRLEFDLV